MVYRKIISHEGCQRTLFHGAILNVELKTEVDEHSFYFCFYENSVLEQQRAGLGNQTTEKSESSQIDED